MSEDGSQPTREWVRQRIDEVVAEMQAEGVALAQLRESFPRAGDTDDPKVIKAAGRAAVHHSGEAVAILGRIAELLDRMVELRPYHAAESWDQLVACRGKIIAQRDGLTGIAEELSEELFMIARAEQGNHGGDGPPVR